MVSSVIWFGWRWIVQCWGLPCDGGVDKRHEGEDTGGNDGTSSHAGKGKPWEPLLHGVFGDFGIVRQLIGHHAPLEGQKAKSFWNLPYLQKYESVSQGYCKLTELKPDFTNSDAMTNNCLNYRKFWHDNQIAPGIRTVAGNELIDHYLCSRGQNINKHTAMQTNRQ